MKRNFNDFELDTINTQLERADKQKSKLIKNIYKEYEKYLQIVRDSLNVSVEKGIKELNNDLSSRNNNITQKESNFTFLRKINQIINSQLPLITIEQLKIKEIDKNFDRDVKPNNYQKEIREIHIEQKDKVKIEYEFISNKSLDFQIKDNSSKFSEYYHYRDNDSSDSLDLDSNKNLKFFSSYKNHEKLGFEKQLINSVLEMINEDNLESRNFENLDNYEKVISSKYQNLDCFDLIDNSLNKLLLNFSYMLNMELFKAKLIEKIISKETFKFLLNEKIMIKHPFPFILNFEFNIKQLLGKEQRNPSIFLLNISLVELEFKYLNLTIQRKKINELKNQFKVLIRKELYWKQKEKNLNKMIS